MPFEDYKSPRRRRAQLSRPAVSGADSESQPVGEQKKQACCRLAAPLRPAHGNRAHAADSEGLALAPANAEPAST